jgi:ribulose-5-phosphate 4-epimerase/fuculose-1-phosphate aldolase
MKHAITHNKTDPNALKEQEKQARIELAAAYRLVHHFGWSDLVSTHISMRVPGPNDHFLINPYGFLFSEITASSLVKVDFAGKKVEESQHGVNPAGFNLHSAVHMAQHHLTCVLHTHTPAGIAVATAKQGLLPITQQALLVLGLSAYHDYEGVSLDESERDRVVADLGSNRILFLRNHGLLTVGTTVAEAFMHMYHAERACRAQVAFLSQGLTHFPLEPGTVKLTQQQGRKIYAQDGFYQNGDLLWPALLRLLDNSDASFRN